MSFQETQKDFKDPSEWPSKMDCRGLFTISMKTEILWYLKLDGSSYKDEISVLKGISKLRYEYFFSVSKYFQMLESAGCSSGDDMSILHHTYLICEYGSNNCSVHHMFIYIPHRFPIIFSLKFNHVELLHTLSTFCFPESFQSNSNFWSIMGRYVKSKKLQYGSS